METKLEWDQEDLAKRRPRIYGQGIPGFIFVHPNTGGAQYKPQPGQYVAIRPITRITGEQPHNHAGDQSYFSTLYITEGAHTTLLYLLETLEEVQQKMLGHTVPGELMEEKENE